MLFTSESKRVYRYSESMQETTSADETNSKLDKISMIQRRTRIIGS